MTTHCCTKTRLHWTFTTQWSVYCRLPDISLRDAKGLSDASVRQLTEELVKLADAMRQQVRYRAQST